MFDLFRSHECTDSFGHMALGRAISDSTFRCMLKIAAAAGTRHLHHSGSVPALDKQPLSSTFNTLAVFGDNMLLSVLPYDLYHLVAEIVEVAVSCG